MSNINDHSELKCCPICHEEIDYFAYGICNHPTCIKCTLKLRKFGSADEPDFSNCPTCRQNMNRVGFYWLYINSLDFDYGKVHTVCQSWYIQYAPWSGIRFHVSVKRNWKNLPQYAEIILSYLWWRKTITFCSKSTHNFRASTFLLWSLHPIRKSKY